MDSAQTRKPRIVALRNEKGSYNGIADIGTTMAIVALRNEKGSYNSPSLARSVRYIVALRNEKGSYNVQPHLF